VSAANATHIDTAGDDNDPRWTLRAGDDENTQTAYLDRCDFLREFEERVNDRGQLDRSDSRVRSELAELLERMRAVPSAATNGTAPRLAPTPGPVIVEDEYAELEAMTPIELDDWEPQDLSVVGRERPKPPVIRGLLYASTNHLWFGPFSSSKTMLAAWCALEVIQDGGNVLWLDVDGGHPSDLNERMRSFGLTELQIKKPEDGGNLIYLRPTSALGGQRDKVIAQICRDHDVRLVVVDSAIGTFSMEGKDPDKAQDVNAWWQQVGDHLQGHRAAIVLIAHSGLAADAQTRVAHSQRFSTIAAVVYQLKTGEALRRGEPGEDITGTTSIIVKKDRPSYHRVARDTSLGTFTITSHCIRDTELDDEGNVTDPGEWTLTAELAPPLTGEKAKDDTWRPTILMERASRKVEEAREPYTKNALKLATNGRGEIVAKAIDYLIQDGYLRSTNPGQRGSKLELVRAYRAPADEPKTHLYEDDE
jgi:hypothetical protein